jgi:hypothetical protein
LSLVAVVAVGMRPEVAVVYFKVLTPFLVVKHFLLLLVLVEPYLITALILFLVLLLRLAADDLLTPL